MTEFFDDERLYQEAIRMGIHPEEWKAIDEKAPGLFERMRGHRPQLYLDLMETVVYEVARRGEGVIVGHGSQVLLREFGCALHVLIHASRSYRIRQLMHERGLSQPVAERWVFRSDHEYRGFMRFAFHIDGNDLSLYDLVVNPEKIGIEGSAKLIVKAAHFQTIKECSIAALNIMERLELMKKVEATLLKNHFSLPNFHLEVSKNGWLEINGFVYTGEEKERLIKIVEGIPDLKKVEVNVAVLPSTI
jgi:cytidylate kinase